MTAARQRNVETLQRLAAPQVKLPVLRVVNLLQLADYRFATVYAHTHPHILYSVKEARNHGDGETRITALVAVEIIAQTGSLRQFHSLAAMA